MASEDPPDFGLQTIGKGAQAARPSEFTFQAGDPIPIGIGFNSFVFESGDRVLDGGGTSFVQVAGTALDRISGATYEGWEETLPVLEKRITETWEN